MASTESDAQFLEQAKAVTTEAELVDVSPSHQLIAEPKPATTQESTKEAATICPPANELVPSANIL